MVVVARSIQNSCNGDARLSAVFITACHILDRVCLVLRVAEGLSWENEANRAHTFAMYLATYLRDDRIK